MFKGKDGQYCLAKISYFISLLTMLWVIAQNPNDVDYQGMAIFLAATGAVYWGRSDTKAKHGDKNA